VREQLQNDGLNWIRQVGKEEVTVAVASRGDALSAVQQLINDDPVEARTILRDPYLPDGLEPSEDPVGMDPSTLIGGYGSESRYRLGGKDPDTRVAIAHPPAEVLSGRPSIKSDTVAEYVKTSLDLTMEGGTTSGVVYPLAVCELATNFRFRNVGGASAGAIAAALTAAAELGRSSQILASGGLSQHETKRDPSSGPTNGFDVRVGFTGLADVMSWLTQTRTDDQEKDEYRLAQLFRAGNATAAIFRVLIAIMRGQSWPLPLLALFAFGWIPRLFTLALISGAIVLTGYLEWKFTGAVRTIAEIIGLGAVGLLAFVATVVGIALILQGIRSGLGKPATEDGAPSDWLPKLHACTSGYATPRSMTIRQLSIGGVLILLVVIFASFRPALYASAILVGLAASVVIAVGLLGSILNYVDHLRSRAFGLIAGTTPQRSRNLLDLMAAVPKPTVDKSLVPWLNGCLNALAGLPDGQVLRFGHLWSGLDYQERRASERPEDLARWRQLWEHRDHRLVNLELMTTDLTRQRPFRFPLDPTKEHDPEQLWVCVDQLRDGESQMFPELILQALSETKSRKVRDRHGIMRTLHKLPQPWDLPVIFAVRLSMSLPALFQAVPLYLIREPVPIQDDLGHTILDQGKPVTLLRQSDVAQDLWFSDGGITSNFPVHFFDNALPRWPTVSLNLDVHPQEAPHQDVCLPEDWDEVSIPVRTVGSSGLSFGKAIFDTALSWRDSMQSALPGYRNRIGQVRTSLGEGGTNLFMPREIIASLALRGALAGARLRTRFISDAQWNRFRWLRLRTAMSNMENLRANTFGRRGFYADALSGEVWLREQKAAFSAGPSDIDIPWHEPHAGFWPKAPRLLNTFADGYRPDEDPVNLMTYETPQPEPVIRQVPRE
jgi:predicted acylesterase/phospholipase RssA